MSEEKLNIYQKLLEIQKSVSGLAKDKKANSYSYVTGDKVLDHIKPLMNKLGLILKQEVLSIENVRQDYFISYIQDENTKEWRGKPKAEINSKVMMKFTWVDCATGDKDENLFGANGQNDWDKGVGSALTYGERYFLLKFFHIATDEDDVDNPDRQPKEPNSAAESPQTPQYPQNDLPWINDKQVDAIVLRIQAGEIGLIEQAKKTYKISKVNSEKLYNAKSKNGNSNINN